MRTRLKIIAWGVTTLYVVLALAVLAMVGCVDGTPFEPEMCTFQAPVVLTKEQLARCALPKVTTEMEGH